jgi:hypothetical protein
LGRLDGVPADPLLPPVFTRKDARTAGLTRHAVAHRLETGRWRRLGQGAFCVQARWDDADARGRHALEIAAQSRHDPGLVVSHASAAALYGWPVPWDGYGRATFTDGRRAGKNLLSPDRLVRAAPLPSRDVVAHSGTRVTSPQRTVADLLRHLPASEAVAIADAAVRRGDVTLAAVDAVLQRQRGWPGIVGARRARAWVDPRRDSYLESSSFALLAGRGIRPPLSQVHVFGATGRFIGIVDGLWLPEGVVAECDGRTKYDLDVVGRLDARQVRRELMREKRREDALRATQLSVVRWGTTEVRHQLGALAATIQAALEAGSIARFTGQLRMSGSPSDVIDLRSYPRSAGDSSL